MITASLGGAALLAGLALAGFGAGLSAWAGVRRDAVLARVGRRGLYAAAAAVVLASGALEWALLGHQFELAYVTEHTDRSLSWPLLASSFYGGQEGSLLYWTLVLTVLGSVAVAAAGRSGVRLRAYATAILAALAGFFLALLVFVASPFDLLEITPADGLGLNPILRDGGMLTRPSCWPGSAPSRFPSRSPWPRCWPGAMTQRGWPRPGGWRWWPGACRRPA